ncbi:MAG: cellulase family glycosylhydrolase [Elusimicrobia bacterium]|nr:cellulase family glycosylhydrolase [Elusimicrobiota bacterium]
MRRIFFLVLSFFFCLLPFGHALEIGLNAENLPDLVSYLPDMGIRSVRIMVRWQAVEPYENPTEEARARLTGENREVIERMRRRGIVIAPPVQDLDTNGFYWEKYDERFEAAQRSGLDVLFTLRATSLWGTVQKARLGTKGGYVVASRPKDMQRWKDFVAAFVSRYKGRGVRVFYEVENEVNAKAFWTGSPEDYVALLKETYQTIKASDPSALVLHAAMA